MRSHIGKHRGPLVPIDKAVSTLFLHRNFKNTELPELPGFIQNFLVGHTSFTSSHPKMPMPHKHPDITSFLASPHNLDSREQHLDCNQELCMCTCACTHIKMLRPRFCVAPQELETDYVIEAVLVFSPFLVSRVGLPSLASKQAAASKHTRN